ncbi:MAG: glutamate racemase [Thermoleophilia bacterium]|nr:glutamate racemase [Thermoleophilia bacterium]
MDPRPIGMFDSGVGGLTVLHECLVSIPEEDFIYLGDTGRFPYGPRSADEIKSYAWQIASHLLSLDVKLLVVACNSATAAALPWLQERLMATVIGAVLPESEAAARTTRNRRVGVLATEATVASGSYERALLNLDAGLEVFLQPCPRLASLIQEGDVSSPEMVETVKHYAAPLREAGADTVILGCTHYPLVTPMLQRTFGRDVILINSAREMSLEVGDVLKRMGIANDPSREGKYSFLCTGDVDSFRRVGARFLQMPLTSVERVKISDLERTGVA